MKTLRSHPYLSACAIGTLAGIAYMIALWFILYPVLQWAGAIS